MTLNWGRVEQGYNDHTTFPRGRFFTAVLTNSAQLISSTPILVTAIIVGGGAANETQEFRRVGAGEILGNVQTLANTVSFFDHAFEAPDLEVFNTNPAGDVSVTVFYVDL